MKLFVLGIDGVPYTFIKKMIKKGNMPFLSSILNEKNFSQMDSVYPVISSVAWTSFSTGVDPSKHSISGFVDTNLERDELTIPFSNNIKTKTIYTYLTENNKRIISINVPLTTPPYKINGIMVSGFLSLDIKNAVYPKEIANELLLEDYIIDADPLLADENKDLFLDQIFKATEIRKKITLNWIKNKEWDYFQLHIMGTDRINHFFLDSFENENNEYHQKFMEYYNKLDDIIKEIYNSLEDNNEFIILSDHGFEIVDHKIDLNYFLAVSNYLKYNNGLRGFNNLDKNSDAFSLVPGRVYVKNKKIKDKLIEDIYNLELNGKKVISKVYKKEELYISKDTNNNVFKNLPELIVIPKKGIELRSLFNFENIEINDNIKGIHNYNDALVYIKNKNLKKERFSIISMFPTICKLMNIEIPDFCKMKSIIE